MYTPTDPLHTPTPPMVKPTLLKKYGWLFLHFLVANDFGGDGGVETIAVGCLLLKVDNQRRFWKPLFRKYFTFKITMKHVFLLVFLTFGHHNPLYFVNGLWCQTKLWNMCIEMSSVSDLRLFSENSDLRFCKKTTLAPDIHVIRSSITPQAISFIPTPLIVRGQHPVVIYRLISVTLTEDDMQNHLRSKRGIFLPML